MVLSSQPVYLVGPRPKGGKKVPWLTTTIPNIRGPSMLHISVASSSVCLKLLVPREK